MYNNFYGFNISPFNMTSNPQFFFESASHREALAKILYGIKEKKGIILLTGEVGTGKTTLCRAILDKLEPQVKVSLVLNPYFSEVQLLQVIAEDFGLQINKKSRLEIFKALNQFLLGVNDKGGGNAVLIIDEAQHLGNRQLEQIRLLSNLENLTEKLLQIVLVGQPELTEKLNQFRLRQLRQRIFVKHDIAPLMEEEVKDYINLRLKSAGGGNINFLPESYKVIYQFSKGIPRLINLLCDRTLIIGFIQEKKIFDQEIFIDSVKEIG